MKKQKYTEVTPERENAAIAAYLSGDSLNTSGRKTGMASTTVLKILKTKNIPRRSRREGIILGCKKGKRS